MHDDRVFSVLIGISLVAMMPSSHLHGCHVQVPKVGSHLAEQDVHPTMYCSHWFITIFAYTLPFDHLLRVWDIFLLEGIKIVFR